MALTRRFLDSFFHDDIIVPHLIDDDPFRSSRSRWNEWDRWTLMPFATPLSNLDLAFDLPRSVQPRGYEFHEDNENYYVQLNTSDFKKNEMTVKLEETKHGHHVLHILGEHKESTTSKDDKGITSAQHFKFTQRIDLGTNVNNDGITASIASDNNNGGVLHVTLPKKEVDKPPDTRIIPITTET